MSKNDFIKDLKKSITNIQQNNDFNSVLLIDKGLKIDVSSYGSNDRLCVLAVGFLDKAINDLIEERGNNSLDLVECFVDQYNKISNEIFKKTYQNIAEKRLIDKKFN